MAQLEINFTIKGEPSETIFKLIKKDEWLWLKGISDISDVKEVPVELDPETNTFILKDNNVFEESDEIKEERLLGLSEEYIAAKNEGFELDDDV